jgi:phosphocarrier protein HPr
MIFTEEKRTIEITLDTGMHARPSASFVKLANQFQSDIFVEKNGERVNGKSILGLLTLELSLGTKIDIKATGSDSTAALDALEALIRSNFRFSPATFETHLQ